jgi:hypothetical protein
MESFAGGFVSILEAHEPNCDELEDHEMFGLWYHEVVCGDVRQVSDYYEEKQFDFAVWWHGPEHVLAEDLEEAIAELAMVTEKTIIVACPWGRYDQGALGGNPFELHVNALYPEFLEGMGFTTWVWGEPDVPNKNNLIGRLDLV